MRAYAYRSSSRYGFLCTTFYLNDKNPIDNLSEVIVKEPYEDMSEVSFSSSDENVEITV